MLGFPLDVYRYIRSFVLPIRYDWRTCKSHEAHLIRQELTWYLDAVGERFDFIETEEIEKWTFYGVKLSFRLYIGGREPRIPPGPYSYPNEPKKWYRHRLHWVSDGGL